MRSTAPDVAGLRVALVNWRDGAHPEAGGAEAFVDEVASRLVAFGAVVTLLTSRAPGQSEQETVDGVHTVRRGNRWTVYPRLLAHLAAHRAEVDLVVDCQNGLPFFTPLVLRRRTPVVLLIHHVHQDQFVAHFPGPLARVGQWLEGPASRWVYGRRPVAVVSPSTRTEVRKRLRLRGPLHVVPNGITTASPLHAADLGHRTDSPSIVCVGRLVVHKRMDRLLRALPAVLERRPDLVVHVVGDGPERSRLQRLAGELGISAAVRFHGRTDAAERDALLAAAWITVNPSMGEGWGLGVLEAAALGVPAVAAAVPGLRDAVVPGRTGWLVPERDDPEGHDLAGAVLQALDVLADEQVAEHWSAQCRAWAGTFTWDRTARRLLDVGLAERARRERRPSAEQRRRSDLVTWAELQVADRVSFARDAPGRLRLQDLLADGPEGAYVLLHACDEADTLAIGDRLGAYVLAAQVATGAHLLGDLGPSHLELSGSVGAFVPAQAAPEDDAALADGSGDDDGAGHSGASAATA